MIRSAEIVNVQTHEYTTLEFLPGVNVIKGTSHKGKSSVMRALRWALFNYQPQNTSWKSWFADDKADHSVGIDFTDDQWILRLRGKGNNYLAEDLELSAVGKAVPDEIKKITQIESINFQEQGDEYFLLDKKVSPGQAGKMLNEFVGLQIIDESRTKINGMIRVDKQRLEIVKENIKESKEQLKDFKHLDEATRLVKETHQAQNKLDIASEKAATINDIIYDINKYKLDIKNTELWLKVKDRYEKLLSEQTKLDIHVSKRSKIENIYSDMLRLKKQRENVSQTLKIDLKRYKELESQLDFCQYCGADKKYWKK